MDIERIPLKDRQMVPGLISTDGEWKENKEKGQRKGDSEKRQQHLANMINNIPDNQKKSGKEMGIWEAARTPNSFSVNAQQALDPFASLKDNTNVMFFDIEAIGTPEKMRQKGSTDFFAVTELSFGKTLYNAGEFKRNPKDEIISMAIAPGEKEYKRMKNMISDLKKNPLMGITKDDHRSLLDLIKYSDESVFSEATLNGHSYNQLKGHKRVPAPLSALTSKTLEEVELGLDNIYKKGISIDDALGLFQQSVVESSSRLGGYNIHSYDLPALMGATKNKATQKFLKDASNKSLDFYHGYSAVATNPYTLTGGSTRQEHIHQYLLQRNQIKNPALSSYQYHLAKDDILANIEIAGFTTNKVFDFLEKVKTQPDYALDAAQVNMNFLEVGQEVFSFQSGYFDPNKHEHNLVGRIRYKKNEKGEYELDQNGKKIETGIDPRWKNLDTATPSNERFVIQNFFDGVTLPGADGKEGKKGYGVRLDSKDIEGKTVMLFSETKEDLAQQIHNTFLALDSDDAIGFRKLKAEVDQPFDEYSKMFREGGFAKMEKLYEYLNGEDAPTKLQGKLSKEEWNKKWTDYILEKGGSDELAMRFPHMVERLSAEESVWSSVMTDLNKSFLSKDQKDMVVRHVKNKLDKIDTNKAEVEAKGHKFFQFKFGEDNEVVFNARNTDSIKSKFRQFINGRLTGEYQGTPEESYRVNQINKLKDMITKQFGLIGSEAENVRTLAKGMIKEVQSDGKIETALTEMANMVRERIASKGNSVITRERTDVVTSGRIQAIEKLQRNLPEVMKDGIEHAKTLQETKNAFGKETKLGQFVRQQDERIQELFSRNFRLGNNEQTVKKAGQAAAKYQELLEGIVKSYSQDFDTQIFFREGKTQTPYLVLNERGSGIAKRGARTFEEMMNDSKTAVVALPWIDDDLMVNYGSQRKITVMRSKVNKDGELIHSTTLTDALSSMKSQAGDKLNEIKLRKKTGLTKNMLFEVQRGLDYAARRHVDPVASESSRRLSFDETQMFDAPSKAASRTKGAYWDITGFAEEWFRKKAVDLGVAKNTEHAISLADKMAKRAEETHTSFFDQLTQKYKSIAVLGDLHDYATERTGGLRGSIHGVNSSAANKGYIGTTPTDARRRIAMGALLGDAGENPLKVVNYRKLDQSRATETLEKAGRNQAYRTLSTFVASDEYELTQGDLRGVTMKTAYMSDEELALPLKDQKKIEEYKKWIDEAVDKGRINEKEARAMKQTLSNAGLSTSEGLAVIDAELVSAYNGWDEVRINDFKAQGLEVKLHNTIEAAIQEHALKEGIIDDINDMSWKSKGIEFENPLVLKPEQVSSLINKDGEITLGKYMRNGIETNVTEGRRLRKDKSIAIFGFNTDEVGKSTLVMGRERLAGHGTKIVTENGFRATVTPMLREIIEDVTGVKGAEFIRSNLEGEKKRTNNAADYIRGIDMDIRQQFEGSISKRIKGYDTAEDALSAFYSDLEKELGIKTEVREHGIRTISSDWGYNHDGGDLLDKGKYKDLMNEWNQKLGNEGRWVAASEVRAHNVFTDFGKLNAGKITTKEIDMWNQGSRLTGVINPDEQSAVSSWLMERAFGEQASPEVKAKQKVFGEILKVEGNRGRDGFTPKAGDAVIDYTSEGNAVTDGKLYSLSEDGVIQMSKDAYQPVIEREKKGQMLTVGDYNKTVVNAEGLVVGEKTVVLPEGNNKVDVTLGDLMKQQAAERGLGVEKGTTYLKLPEEFKNQYIPLIDAERYPTAGASFKDYEIFLDDIQGKYAAIDKELRTYNNLHVTDGVKAEDVTEMKKTIIGNVDRHVTELNDILASKATSNKGTADFLSAKLENSTRLQSSGINPALAYKKNTLGEWVNNTIYDEATQYINPADARKQIQGIEENIAKSWDLDPTKIDGDLGDYLIANWNDHDTYGITNRNPSIHTNTIQATKIKLDESVGIGQMRSMRGTSDRIKEDYDGDQKGLFLSMYGEQDDQKRGQLIDELKKRWKVEHSENTYRAQGLMNELEENFRTSLFNEVNTNSDINGGQVFTRNHSEINTIVDQFFSKDGLVVDDTLTLGKLRGQEVFDTIQGVLQEQHERMDYYEDWGKSKYGLESAKGKVEAETTHLARATHGTIGSMDNLRMKMETAFQTRSEFLYKRFGDAAEDLRYSADQYRRENAMVFEFLREFSQKSISSKHADGQDIYQEVEGLYSILERVRGIKNEQDLESVADDIINRGMFKKRIRLENGMTWSDTGKTNHEFVTETLGLIRESERDWTTLGVDSNHASMLNGASQGMASRPLGDMVQSGASIPSTTNRFMAEVANEQGHSAMLEAHQQVEDKMARLHENKMLNRKDRISDSGVTSDIINNKSVSQPRILSNDTAAIHRTIKDGMQDTLSDIATKTKHTFNASAAGMIGMAGLSFAGLWATNALMKGAPTPEGLQEMAPVNPDVMTQPTARVTPNQNGEYINISVSAKTAKNMNTSDLAAMLNNEIMAMSNISMKTHVNVNDNSANIDQRFVEGAVANAMTKGYAY